MSESREIQMAVQEDRRPRRMTISFPDPEKIGNQRQARYYYNKRVTVYFSPGDPLAMAAHQMALKLTAAGIRRLLAIDTYGELLEKATAAGQRPGVYIRHRLQSAVEA
jgi:hypothetical protein